jgi:hypothetical protein
MKDVARCVYEEVEPDLDSNIYDYYFELIRELEIDFKLFIVYEGEFTKARAIATRCFSPPDKLVGK